MCRPLSVQPRRIGLRCSSQIILMIQLHYTRKSQRNNFAVVIHSLRHKQHINPYELFIYYPILILNPTVKPQKHCWTWELVKEHPSALRKWNFNSFSVIQLLSLRKLGLITIDWNFTSFAQLPLFIWESNMTRTVGKNWIHLVNRLPLPEWNDRTGLTHWHPCHKSLPSSWPTKHT